MRCLLLALSTLLSGATLEDVTARTPLHFEPNLGQFESGVQFAARGPNLSILLSPAETVLVRPGAEPVKMRLSGGRASKLEAVDRLPGVSNYYWGPDPKMWRERVPHYGRVRARSVYEGVDLVYHSNGKRLEYDFVVAPGADPSRIELAFEGAGRIELSREGDLVLVAKSGEMRHRRPVVYQEVSGRRVEVAGRYRIREGRVGFELGEYDVSKPLVIDPILEYGTYFGGAGGTSFPTAIAADASGAIVVAGTSSVAIPVLNPLDAGVSQGAFVTRFQPGGATIAFSTFLPGGVSGVAVDGAGNVFVTGSISTGSFPVRNAIQPQFAGNSDGFVARLTPSGGLVFGTYLGGTGHERLTCIAVDAQSVIVAGESSSVDFPGIGGPVPAGSRGVAAKLTPDGSVRLWSTQLGGTIAGVALDSMGSVYMTGSTQSVIATPGAFQSTVPGTSNVFAAKLSNLGQSVYVSQFGGSSGDGGRAIAVDASGQAYVVGAAGSTNFPVVNAFLGSNPSRGGFGFPGTAFLAALNATGSALVFSTYFGGSGRDLGQGVVVMPNGDIVMGGWSFSSDLPLLNPWKSQLPSGAGSAFLARFTNSGQLRYSTYYASASPPVTQVPIAAAPDGAVVVATIAFQAADGDPDVVTPGAYDTTRNGLEDVVIGRFVDGPAPVPVTITSSPPGRRLLVNGKIVTTPSQLQWQPSSPHVIDATVEADQETVFPFRSWSDGGGIVHRVVTPAGGATYQANFESTPCTFAISPQPRLVSFLQTTVSLTVTTQNGCSWRRISDNFWLLPEEPAIQTGSGTFRVAVDWNPGFVRTGSVRVGNATATVTQGGGSVFLTPSGLTAGFPPAGNASKRATLFWSAAAGATGYEVFATQLPLSATVASPGRLVYFGRQTGNAGTNSATIDMVDGAYQFFVRACQGGGFGDANCGSALRLRATSQLSAPSTAPAVTFPSEGQVLTSSTHQFRWDAVPGASSYSVRLTIPELNQVGRSTVLDIRTTDTNTIFTMPSSADYQLTVNACSEGCSASGPVRKFSVQLLAVPAAPPAGLTAQVVNGNTINASWNPVPGADLYRVQAVQPNTGPGGGALTVAARQISTTTISLPAPAGAATLVVNACNGDGCGPPATAAVNPTGPNPCRPPVSMGEVMG